MANAFLKQCSVPGYSDQDCSMAVLGVCKDSVNLFIIGFEKEKIAKVLQTLAVDILSEESLDSLLNTLDQFTLPNRSARETLIFENYVAQCLFSYTFLIDVVKRGGVHWVDPEWELVNCLGGETEFCLLAEKEYIQIDSPHEVHLYNGLLMCEDNNRQWQGWYFCSQDQLDVFLDKHYEEIPPLVSTTLLATRKHIHLPDSSNIPPMHIGGPALQILIEACAYRNELIRVIDAIQLMPDDETAVRQQLASQWN